MTEGGDEEGGVKPFDRDAIAAEDQGLRDAAADLAIGRAIGKIPVEQTPAPGVKASELPPLVNPFTKEPGNVMPSSIESAPSIPQSGRLASQSAPAIPQSGRKA